MIGSGMSRVWRYAAIVAVVLLVGTQFLTSAIDQVALLRTGNVLPLLPVIAVAVFLMLLARPRESETPLLVLINILAWTATGYLCVVSFVFVLPFGYVPSIVAAGLTATLFGQLRSPANIQEITRSISIVLAPYSPTLVRRISSKAIARARISEGISMWTVPHVQSSKITKLLQTRPMLPIALTHYIDFDVLKIEERKDSVTKRQVLHLLESSGISGLERTSDLFTRVVINIPVIGEALGHPMQDFCIIHDELTLERILPEWPIGATLFSDGTKRVMIVKAEDVIGYNSARIPKGLEPWVLVKHDLSMVALEEV